ncbi:MAG: monovalent cation:proton antiporter-2 (CPA2) family protein [Pseudomonadota bacterium]
MHTTLPFVLILLAAAVLVVVAFRIARLPPMLGYLLVGIVAGPHALGFMPESENTRYLAEFGVVFLMFSIGLEFSLPKLIAMRRTVFGFGAAQVAATMTVVLLFCLLYGLDWRAGFALGGVIAMSSTAIVSKLLSERLELNTHHGRQIMGVLLFQDIAVVPLLIIVPALAQEANGMMAATLAVALAKAAAALALILFLGQRVMRSWFHLVAMQKSSELFMLNVLLITLGLAYFTEFAGLSLALGAFLAGILISETEYRYQVESDIKPFRDVLLGLFFVTIGMLLNLGEVVAHWWAVAAVFVALVVGKTMLVAALSRALGSDHGMALRTGLGLAQAGEFGFVLLAQAGSLHLLDDDPMQVVLGAMLLSMMVTPFIIQHSERIARRLSSTEWTNRAMELHQIAVQTMAIHSHVIICGYGRSGQKLGRLLEQENVPFIALDLDPQRVKAAAAAGESVVYGDAARREVLIAAGIVRAKALVIAYSDTDSALNILSQVQELRPGLPVVVRTVDDSDIDRLKDAGAAEVVAEIMEGSLMLASHALMLTGMPLNRVLRRIRETRENRYNVFRGFFRGISDSETDDDMQLRLHSVLLNVGAYAIGKTLAELRLENCQVDITAVRRKNTRSLTPAPDSRLEAGDVLVLRGNQESLACAEMRLLQG